MKFCYRDACRIRAMRRRRLPDATILGAFAGKYTLDEIQWQLAEMRRRDREYHRENYVRGYVYESEISIAPPPDVVARQQERLMLWPKTITALICGDPLPGESELDKRNGRIALPA